MLTPRTVSPLLDGFALSNPISRHDATQCVSALEQATGAHYVVKTIHISQSGVLSGSLQERANADKAGKAQAQALAEEAKALGKLSTMGYFAAYEDAQIVPAEDRSGYEVYLLAPHRPSLQHILHKPGLTQLEVINMALDICSALSTCRRAGYFYANLKPSNIFYTGQHYRIGDLGFVSMSTLGHAPLPASCRNRYTPGELQSGQTALNDTADLYALGMILYEAYNGGNLPGKTDVAGALWAPPKYADYEMAEIILRACALDPAIRWHDPEQMSAALSRYLRRNGMRNTPVVPAVTAAVEDEDAYIEPFLPEDYDPAELTPEVPKQPVRRKRKPARKQRPNRGGILLVLILAAVLALEILVGIVILKPDDTDDTPDNALTITSLTAMGNQAGDAVTLSLTWDDSQNSKYWTVTYWSDDGVQTSLNFAGHTVMVRSLESGTSYTFVITAQDGTALTGQTQVQFTTPAQD